MIWIVLVSTIAYILLVGLAIYSWKKKAITSPNTNQEIPEPTITVLVPFRNEASYLVTLLRCLNQQSLNHRHWNCIFINDHSDDNGIELLQPLLQSNFMLIHSLGLGKKAAIASALPLITTDYVVQTDADCNPGPQWLESIGQTLKNHPNAFLTGPVAINNPQTSLEHFQAMDLMALMGMTRAGIETGMWHMANGANMAYPTSLQKDRVQTISGQGFSSGDDMFLIEAAHILKDCPILFFKDPRVLVRTAPCKDISSFLQQRIRWGTKNAAMRSIGIKIALFIPLLFNLIISILTVVIIINPSIIYILIVSWMGKIIVDFIYLYTLSPYFQYRIKPLLFLVCSAIYPFYLTYLSILSIFKSHYEWKGRVTK